MSSFRLSALVLVLAGLTPLAAMAQRCDTATLGDTVCDCGCGSTDTACSAGNFIVCATNHCPAGQVPWESSPSACMTSACGDGWNDTASGEVCDDGNALAAGGCSADCRAVTAGYVCGEAAKGCHLAPIDAGTPAMDAGTQPADGGTATDAGQSDAGAPGNLQPDAGGDGSRAPTGGCSSAPGFVFTALASLLALRRRRSKV